MAVPQEVITKIGKLLALGQSSNEHEAALAVSKAQELMQKHDLQMADLNKYKPNSDEIQRADKRRLRERGKPGKWKIDLYKTVARTSDCWVYDVPVYEGGKRHDAAYMIGRPQDIELAEYTFDFLVSEIERLAAAYSKRRWDELADFAYERGISTHEAEQHFSVMGNHPLRSVQSWKVGAAEAVASELTKAKRARDRADDASNALVVNKDMAIRDWWARQHGYADWADYMEKIRATGKQKPLTAEERRKVEADIRRAQRRQEAEYRRKYASMDMRAYREGADAGRSISVRPGVGQPDRPDGLIE